MHRSCFINSFMFLDKSTIHVDASLPKPQGDVKSHIT